MAVPSWLRDYLNESGVEKIEKTVAEIEKKTAGEIVPMVVYRSTSIGHIPVFIYCVGFLLYFVFGVQDWLVDYIHHSWWVILIWALLLIPITWALSRWHFLQRVLVSPIDRDRQVWERAELEFHRAGLNKTDGSTGLLLFISFVDHEAVVLGDSAIADKFEKKDWQETVDILVRGVRAKKMAEGFCDAIHKCGSTLAEDFPISPDDTNELPNRLIIKD